MLDMANLALIAPTVNIPPNLVAINLLSETSTKLRTLPELIRWRPSHTVTRGPVVGLAR